MEKHQQWTLWYFLVAFSLLLVAQDWWASRSAVESLPYSEFMRLLKEQKVGDLRIEQQQISGTLKEPINNRTQFTTVRVEPELAEALSDSQVTFSGTRQGGLFSNLLGWL